MSVTLLGINSICHVSVLFFVISGLTKKGWRGVSIIHFWHRCILASLAAKILAKRVRVTNEEEIFLAGLLQDLGVLVMSEALGMEYGLIYKKAAQDHQALEALEHGSMENRPLRDRGMVGRDMGIAGITARIPSKEVMTPPWRPVAMKFPD